VPLVPPVPGGREVPSARVATAMLRAGLVPAAAAAFGCLVLAWSRDGAGAAAAALLGGITVLVALSVGPLVVAVTRGSSPGVTFVAAVGGYFGLVWVLGVSLVALIDADWLSAGYLSLTLIVGTVAGVTGMIIWTVRARIPVYERADPPS
jgi:hypothetical protein